MRKYLTEFIGTFFLVLTVGLVANKGSSAGAMGGLAIGCSLMIMVYMGGHVSGGHYNPAVSLAVFMRGKLKAKDFGPYLIAQFLGAIIAAYAAFAVMGQQTIIAPTPLHPAVTAVADAVTTKPDVAALAAAATKGINLGMCFLIETLYTFALALVVLNVATAKETANNSFYGLAIGFTVVVGAYAGGGISGGAFNPAVGSGLIVVDGILGGSWQYLWLYLAGPFLGGAIAALVFREQHPDATAAD